MAESALARSLVMKFITLALNIGPAAAVPAVPGSGAHVHVVWTIEVELYT